jgi:imidazolonepropionase-like amidohydrolase
LVSDTGQRHNPMPADALRIFAQSVFESGVSEEDVHTLIAVNPAELLGLPARAPAAEEGTDARV